MHSDTTSYTIRMLNDILQAERFPPPPSKTPGPGSYTVSKESDWIRNTYPPPEAIEVPRSVSFHNRDMVRVCNEIIPFTIYYINYFLSSATSWSCDVPPPTDGSLNPNGRSELWL